MFGDGGVTIRWSYIHTGGQPLNNISVTYTFEEGATVGGPIVVSIDDTEATSFNVPRISTGVRYTFNITAENDIGASYIICGPHVLHVGKAIERKSRCHIDGVLLHVYNCNI